MKHNFNLPSKWVICTAVVISTYLSMYFEHNYDTQDTHILKSLDSKT